jgi:hypothetical protein
MDVVPKGLDGISESDDPNPGDYSIRRRSPLKKEKE